MALPVIWRRVVPRLACAGFLAAMVLTALPAFDISRCGIAVPVLLLLAFTVASRLDLLDALSSLALLLAGGAVLSATDPQLASAASRSSCSSPPGAFAGGRVARSFGLLGARLQERTRLLELERGHTARLATEVDAVASACGSTLRRAASSPASWTSPARRRPRR